MPVIGNNSDELQGVTSNACIQTMGTCTVSALAIIQPRDTVGRPAVPACFNGFNTSDTAFAKGHIVSLDLGGPNISENVVPQFKFWQANGPWRQLEADLKRFKGHLILVNVFYTRSNEIIDRAVLLERFEKNCLMDWIDQRIPNYFEIRVFKNPGIDPSSITTDAQFESVGRKLMLSGSIFVMSSTWERLSQSRIGVALLRRWPSPLSISTRCNRVMQSQI
jgi:hypothetical protein